MASPTEITATGLSIAVLLTCFNRREKTLSCLRRLAAQDLPAGHRLEIFLVDDGCTDGTGEAVRAEFPHVRVIQGTGSLYWAGGMRLAWAEAAKTQPDYFLLLNDDTEIVPEAIATLLAITGPPEARVIAVAPIADPASGKIIYGAYRHGSPDNQFSADPITQCGTFNANCTLIPKAVFEEIGALDKIFTHGLADLDYGLRAFERGIQITQAGGTLGFCSPNNPSNTWRDSSLPRMKRLRMSQSPLGSPVNEWFVYCRRHLGNKWLICFISPYIKIILGK
jgi:GT2 family glycosyltransferase